MSLSAFILTIALFSATLLYREHSMSSPNNSRSVIKSVLAVETPEGDGATVRRSIGSSQLRNLSPFLMLDHFHLPKEGAGFPDHPHSGMTTVTYMLSGSFQHEDSEGNAGTINAGDLQWMTAGKAIVHAEMPVFGPGLPKPTGLQLWIDLPNDQRNIEPSYQDLKAEAIPTAHPSSDVEIKVISGVSRGNDQEDEVVSPVKPIRGCHYYDILLKKEGATAFQAIPEGWTGFIYVISGRVKLGSNDTVHNAFHTLVLSSQDGENGIKITSASDSARVVLITGEPLDQETLQHGPFVAKDRAGMEQIFFNYRQGVNGFETAKNWKSRIGGR